MRRSIGQRYLHQDIDLIGAETLDMDRATDN